MTKSLRIAQMALVLSLTVPGLAWAGPAQALIVYGDSPEAAFIADVVANLTTHLTGKGFTVITSVGVPGSLAGNQQVWDVRPDNSTPLTASDITAYTAYLAAGGSLFVDGENAGFLMRDNTIVTLVAAAGGGIINLAVPANAETVLTPFTGPTPLGSITFLAAEGVRPPSRARAIARDASNIAASVVFGPGMLSNAPAGSLILVFDVNFLSTSADANSQIFTDNLIGYLAAPFVVQGNMPAVQPHDLDGDLKSDVVWRQTQTGDVGAWLMNGATVKQESLVLFGVPLAWQIAGVGDVDGDGKADLIWRETQTGDVLVSLSHLGLSCLSVESHSCPLPTDSVQTFIVALGVPLAWQIAGVGDLDGDGKADLIWRNTLTGDVQVWLMNGAIVKQTTTVASGVLLAWQIVGVGDLNGDGMADLIWRNTQTGDVGAWLMNGATRTRTAIVSAGLPLAWQFAGVGDLNGDFMADLIWRNTQTGDVAAWLMNGVAATQTATVSAGLPLAWQIAEVGDLDGDGKADLVFRNTQTGDVALWLMNGVAAKQVTIVASGVPLAWQIQ